MVDVERWLEVDPDDFPTRGYVFWAQAKDAVRDALVFFRPKDNTAKMLDLKDEFMLAEPHSALEILDLRSIGKAEEVRLALDSGLDLPTVPPAKPLLWTCENILIGPVALVHGPEGTTLEKNNRHRIRFFHPRSGDVRQVSHDGLTRHVFARTSLGAPDGFVDWDDDKPVVRRALEFAADTAKKSGSSLELSKHLVDEAAEAIAGGGSNPELRWRLNELERTRSLIESLRKNADLAGEVVDALRKHPLVEKELEEVRATERKAAREDADKALTDVRQEIARLTEERAAADAALETVRRSIKEAEHEGLRKAAEAEERIRVSIETAVRSVPELVAQIAILKPFLGGTNSAPQPRVFSAGTHPRWKTGQATISSIRDLRIRMSSLLKSMGMSTPVYQRLHAAFCAHLLPCVGGPRAVELLKAYATVATADRIKVVQVTGTLTEPGDIFGKVDPARSRFVPHAAGLIDVVLAARESTGLMLVVLDGANRGATESYLLPLVQTALRRSGPLALFHPSAVSADDPYKPCSLIEWPENLLLAVTLVEGPTTLPVAPDLLAQSVLIETDTAEDAPVSQDSQTAVGASEIDPSSNLLKPAATGGGAALESLDGAVSNAVRHAASRLERGFTGFPNDAAALQSEIVKGVLVPYLASIPDADERAGAVSNAKDALGPRIGAGLEEAVSIARRRLA
ncbi:MAG: hypothetical protein JST11_01085 [Acidobacteria bacterium]|nr:hypothetical protein [Acidobacteriota bacterium]